MLTAAGLARYDGLLFHANDEREGRAHGELLDILRVPSEDGGILAVSLPTPFS